MMYRIDVWENLSGGYCPVGEMVCEIAVDGKGRGAFRYHPDFLKNKGAFALDPVSLQLEQTHFTCGHPGIFPLFEDSLPDDWGRKLLVRKHNIARQDQNLPNLLLALGSSGLGALAFTTNGRPGPVSSDVSSMYLSALLEAAELYERGEINDTGISILLGAGSSPGGARPKALIYDADEDIHFLAKFPSIKDLVDVVKIEAATMFLGAAAGLNVPITRLTPCGQRHALLVKRFDVVPGGRRHMVSMQTLLKAQGYYVCRYQDVLGVVRKYSSNPLVDSSLLFRQMVFNAVIGNTDDHLKNFWMVYGIGEGWRLSPAFDLVPDIGQRGEHVLLFDTGSYYPGRSALAKLGRSWGVHVAEQVVEEVYDAIGQWRGVYRDFGIEEVDIQRFREIDHNLLT